MENDKATGIRTSEGTGYRIDIVILAADGFITNFKLPYGKNTDKKNLHGGLDKISHIYNMTIQEAQERVDGWISRFGVRYFSELTNMALLTEEVGELARIIARKYGEQSFKKGEDEESLPEEMADILWVLICLANQTGVNLTEALEKSFEKKTSRDFLRHRNNEKLT
jgi:NTP pyrophosphatase (non-canonical NTP hydrolase)